MPCRRVAAVARRARSRGVVSAVRAPRSCAALLPAGWPRRFIAGPGSTEWDAVGGLLAGDDAFVYWVRNDQTVFRLAKAGGAPTELAKLPGRVSGGPAIVDGDELFLSSPISAYIVAIKRGGSDVVRTFAAGSGSSCVAALPDLLAGL